MIHLSSGSADAQVSFTWSKGEILFQRKHWSLATQTCFTNSTQQKVLLHIWRSDSPLVWFAAADDTPGQSNLPIFNRMLPRKGTTFINPRKDEMMKDGSFYDYQLILGETCNLIITISTDDCISHYIYRLLQQLIATYKWYWWNHPEDNRVSLPCLYQTLWRTPRMHPVTKKLLYQRGNPLPKLENCRASSPISCSFCAP